MSLSALSARKRRSPTTTRPLQVTLTATRQRCPTILYCRGGGHGGGGDAEDEAAEEEKEEKEDEGEARFSTPPS